MIRLRLSLARFRLLAAVLASFGLACAANAQVVLVDFDHLPGGGTPTAYSSVGDAYAAQGVHFGESLEGPNDPGTGNFVPHASSPTDFVIRDTARDTNGSIGFHLLSRTDQNVSEVSAMPRGPTGLYAFITMTAYDANLTPVASVTVDQVTPTMLALSGLSGVRYVSWISDRPFLGGPSLDWVQFTVPEPGTGLLLGLGLVALASNRRRGD